MYLNVIKKQKTTKKSESICEIVSLHAFIDNNKAKVEAESANSSSQPGQQLTHTHYSRLVLLFGTKLL